MAAEGLSEAAIAAFKHNYEQLAAGVTGMVRRVFFFLGRSARAGTAAAAAAAAARPRAPPDPRAPPLSSNLSLSLSLSAPPEHPPRQAPTPRATHAKNKQKKTDARGRHRPGRRPAVPRRPPRRRRLAGRRRRRRPRRLDRRAARQDGGAQAQRRARHEHGPREGQVPARGERRAHVPRPDRAAGQGPPRPVRARARPLHPHGLVRDLGRHARAAQGAAPGARARGRVGAPAEQVAQGGRGDAGARALAGARRGRVVPARPRRHLPVAAGERDARRPARGRGRVPVRVQLGQPRGHARPGAPAALCGGGGGRRRWWVGRRPGLRDGGLRAHGRGQEGRAPGRAQGRRQVCAARERDVPR